MNKYFILLFLLLLVIARTGTSQSCVNKTEKTIQEQAPLTVQCANYKARDCIVLKPGFTFSSTFGGQNKIVKLTWNYSGTNEGWYPYVKINNTPSNGYALPANHSVGNFYGAIGDLATKLKTALGAAWNVSVSTPNGNEMSISVENFSDFTYNSSSNYSSATITQSYTAGGDPATFIGSIDNDLLLPVTYTYTLPDPQNRTLDKNSSSFGSLPGEINVSPTGAATYSIPIETLPGINGMVPQISINYNSQTGNGMLGWGWNIAGIAAISRVSQNVYSDGAEKGLTLTESDRFSLNGNRLILVSESPLTYGSDGSLYRTESETFVIVKAHTSDITKGPDWFEVVDKEGTTYKYGSSTGRVLAPKNSENLSWQLDYVVDVYGNYIKYDYEQVNSITYIKKIEYGRNESNESLPTNTIEFFYETRDDIVKYRLLRLPITVDRIMHKVRVANNGKDFRIYTFEYSKDFYSRLVKINLFNSKQEKVNPTIFKWGTVNSTVSLNNTIEVKNCVAVDNSPTSAVECKIANADNQGLTAIEDLNNDGKSEIVSLYNLDGIRKAEIYYSSGSTFLSDVNKSYLYTDNKDFGKYFTVLDLDKKGSKDIINPVLTGGPSITFKCLINRTAYNIVYDLYNDSEPICTYEDFNNDGIKDIFYFEAGKKMGSLVLFNPNDFQHPTKIDFPMSVTGTVKAIFNGDYTGDGLIDVLLISDSGTSIFSNTGGAFGSTPKIYDVNLMKSSYPIFRQGDFNGDGSLDFVYQVSKGVWKLAIGSNSIYNIINLSMPLIGDDHQTGDDDNSDNCYVWDFNNDGMQDMVVTDYVSKWDGVDNKKFDHFDVYWYKSTGNGFSEYKKVITSQEIDSYSKYFMMGDFNGDGYTDLMNYGSDILNNSNSERKWRLYSTVVPVNAGKIIAVSNGVDQKTTIEYSNISANPWEELDNGLYSARISYPVVKTVKNKLNTSVEEVLTYAYSQPIYSYLNGFLGFEASSVTNSISNIKNTSVFNFSIDAETDKFFSPMLIRTDVHLLEQSGPKLLNTNAIEYQIKSYGGKRVFIYPYKVTTQDLLEFKNSVATKTYDDDGNVTKAVTEYKEDDATVTATEKVESTTFKSRVVGSLNTIPSAPDVTVATKTHKDDPDKEFTQRTSYSYNNKGKLNTKTINNVTTTLGYDDYGNLVNSTTTYSSATNPITRYINYEPDPTKRFVQSTSNELEHTSSSTYDNWGNKIKDVDINGHITNYVYNGWGKLIEVTSPDGTKVSSITNWSNGDTDAPGDALYATYQYKNDVLLSVKYFDCGNNVILEKSLSNFGVKLFSKYTYYTDGKLNKVSQPDPSSTAPSLETTYEYDKYGRLEKVTSPEGLVTTNKFPTSPTDRTYTVTLSNGEESSKKYDAAGLIAKATDKGGEISYIYHSSWQPVSIMANGGTVTMTYYDDGKQKTITDPDAGTTTYVYNGFGEIWKQTDALNVTTEITYDALGRVQTKKVDETTYSYSYDGANGNGLISSVTSDNADIAGFSYTYDDLSRLSTETRSNNTKSFTYTYGYENGKLITLKYPNNFEVKYTYNEYDNLIKITDANNNLIWRFDDKDAKGRIWKESYGSLKQLVTTHDSNNRLSNLSVAGILNFSYKFNNRSQLEWRDEKYYNSSGVEDGFKINSVVVPENFIYDNVNRLVEVKLGNASQGFIQKLKMDYETSTTTDRIKNKSDAGEFKYEATTNHRITELAAVSGYNPPRHDLTYNSMGKVSVINETNSGVINKVLNIDYGLDAERFKTELVKDNSRKYTRYYFNDYEQEILADNSVRHLNYIYANGKLVAIFEQKSAGDKIHYVYTDYLGSLRCITNPDGTIEQRLSFDAWGNRRDPFDGHKLSETEVTAATAITSRGFTGHEHIDDLGLINMNARFYDPMLGLFISADDYVQAPGNSQNYNRYTYCLNNPLMYTDPDGNFSILATLAYAAGSYLINWLDNVINKDMSPKEAFQQTPVIIGANLPIPGQSNAPAPRSDGSSSSYNTYQYYNSKYFDYVEEGIEPISALIPSQAIERQAYVIKASSTNPQSVKRNVAYKYTWSDSERSNMKANRVFKRTANSSMLSLEIGVNLETPTVYLKRTKEVSNGINKLETYYTVTTLKGNSGAEFTVDKEGRIESISLVGIGKLSMGKDGSILGGNDFVSFGASSQYYFIMDVSIPWFGDYSSVGTAIYLSKRPWRELGSYLKSLDWSFKPHHALANPIYTPLILSY